MSVFLLKFECFGDQALVRLTHFLVDFEAVGAVGLSLHSLVILRTGETFFNRRSRLSTFLLQPFEQLVPAFAGSHQKTRGFG